MSSPNQKITETVSKTHDIPESVEVGDFVVARYQSSEWSRYLPWEGWDHVALISQLNPLKVIEVTGILLQKEKEEIREGVVEYEFKKSREITLLDGTINKNGNLWRLDSLKWNENQWYCSLLIYKSYSRTVTGMYLESYGNPSSLRTGPMVTPEDLVDSPRSKIYHIWKKEN